MMISKELLFEFVRGHYLVRILMPISCHTFISSLEEFCSNDKVRAYLLIHLHGAVCQPPLAWFRSVDFQSITTVHTLLWCALNRRWLGPSLSRRQLSMPLAFVCGVHEQASLWCFK